MLIASAIFRDLPDAELILLVAARLTAAALLGAVVGFERQLEGKSAGIRTHMLVALGAAVFTLIPLAGADEAGVSRVIQGVATGVGFLGAGLILPMREEHKVRGLTTAANIWVTAAAGVATGAGYLWVAILTVGIAWTILDTVHRIERVLRGKKKPPPADEPTNLT